LVAQKLAPVVLVRFELKYFIAALLLTLALLIVDYRIWYVYLGLSTTSFVSYLLPLATLVLSVILPAIVMYLMSTKIQSWSQVSPILISTFLGCFVGGTINSLVETFIPELFFAIDYGRYGVFILMYEISISIVLASFSEVLFVSIAAILFAYYQTHADRTIPSPT
jgi:hypothetical protein